MSKAAQLRLWKTREAYRYRRWRYYVRSRPQGDAKRAAWHAKFAEAVHQVRRLEHELANQSITHLDQAGIDFICAKEGVIPYAYNDSQGHCTYGVGHLIRMPNCTPADYKKYGSHQHPGTQAEAITFFKRDVRQYEAAVRTVMAHSRVPFNQHMFNALVSFCLNIGIAGLLSSTTAHELALGRKNAAANAMLRWNKPPEILGRRYTEFHLFLQGGSPTMKLGAPQPQKSPKFPYNRIVQWLSGPVSVGVGMLFARISVHSHWVVPTSVKNQIVLGVASTVLAAVGAGVTYLAHHKWFTNLANFFYAQAEANAVQSTFTPPADEEPLDVPVEPVTPAPVTGTVTTTTVVPPGGASPSS